MRQGVAGMSRRSGVGEGTPAAARPRRHIAGRSSSRPGCPVSGSSAGRLLPVVRRTACLACLHHDRAGFRRLLVTGRAGFQALDSTPRQRFKAVALRDDPRGHRKLLGGQPQQQPEHSQGFRSGRKGCRESLSAGRSEAPRQLVSEPVGLFDRGELIVSTPVNVGEVGCQIGSVDLFGDPGVDIPVGGLAEDLGNPANESDTGVPVRGRGHFRNRGVDVRHEPEIYRLVSNRWGTMAAYSGSISVTSHRRPSCSAARAVVPVPPKRSRTS